MTAMQVTQADLQGKLIDLGVGHPSDTLLPLELLHDAASTRLAHSNASILQYGTEQGDPHFRHALAQFLTDAYDMPADPGMLFVTTGASQALSLLCTTLTKPGDTIFVEEPTYFLALLVFRDHHLKVRSIPTDTHGLIIPALEETLQEETPTFLYTVPTFQNPTGATLPEQRRETLVNLSQKHGFHIIADEVYHLLHYTHRPPPPLAAYSHTGSVSSIGSFSKILAPGLRLGWIQTSPTTIYRLTQRGLLLSGGGLNPFTSALVHNLLEQGKQTEHLARLRETYELRVQALSEALRAHLPHDVTFTRPSGGFFFWLTLPAGLHADELLEVALEHEVSFKPGNLFSNHGGCRNHLRISFAYYDTPLLQEGVSRLIAAIEQWSK